MNNNKNVIAIFDTDDPWGQFGDEGTLWNREDEFSFHQYHNGFIADISVEGTLERATNIIVYDDRSGIHPKSGVTISGTGLSVTVYQNGKEIARGLPDTQILVPASGRIQVKLAISGNLNDNYGGDGWTSVDYYLGIHHIEYLK